MRDEQITISTWLPLWTPCTVFKYADINYVLLTEIIERVPGKHFYSAMRSLLGYKKLKLSSTWFVKLEGLRIKLRPQPINTGMSLVGIFMILIHHGSCMAVWYDG